MSTPLAPEEPQPRPWIARLLGVAPSSTHKMDLPVVQGGGRGKAALFLPSACVARRIEEIKARDAGRGDLDPVQERALRDHHQGRLAEQLHRRREGDLLEVEVVRHAWSSIVIAVRAKLLRLPSAMADTLAHVSTAAEVEKLLSAEIRATLTELASWEPPVAPTTAAPPARETGIPASRKNRKGRTP